MASSGPKGLQGLLDDLVRAQRVDGDVCAARALELGGGSVRGVEGVRGAVLPGQLEGLGVGVDGNHFRADGGGDHDRGQAHTTAAEDGHALSGNYPADLVHGAERRGEAAAEAGGGSEIHLIRQADQVHLGVRDCHVLGERTPVVEARLELVRADLMIALPALLATTARADEGRGDSIAHLPMRDARTDGGDRASQLVARDVREDDVRVMPHPAVPVAAAQAGRLNLQHHRPLGSLGPRHLAHLRQYAVLLDDNSVHPAEGPLSRHAGDDRSAAGDGGNDRDLAAILDRGLQAVGEAYVVIVDVHVHEPAQLAGVVQHPALDARVRRVERVQHLAQRRAVGGHLGRALGVGPQDGRNPNAHTHCRPAFTKASYDAGMVTLGPTRSATASSVFSPSPELMITVSASGSSWPVAISFFSVATVTPPAVSAKTPSVRASSWIPSMTSSSLTSSIAPPVRRATSRTYGPSAGLPIASDFAIVSGLTGLTTSWPSRNACATGEQPVAWAPYTL